MWQDLDQDSQNLDLDYFTQELEYLKQSLKTPYIDKRAREDNLKDDLLEEIKIAFDEIANKEKNMKQLIQVMEFILK